MSQLQFNKAIERIKYITPAFPKEEFDIIRQNADKAKPIFYEALASAQADPENVPADYQLYFYALLFLGEFQDRDSFEKIVEFVSMPPDMLDLLLADFITDGLNDVLYNTYNGNLELLKNTIRNQDVCKYVRHAMLQVMGQLFFDGTLAKEDLLPVLKELLHLEESSETGDLSSLTARVICQCHLVELLPDIRKLYDEDQIDTFIFQPFYDCVDEIFAYSDDPNANTLCTSPLSADLIKNWAMFKEQPKKTSKASKNKMAKMAFQNPAPVKKVKINRNDPCPCGSGKKYKFCCLNKPKEEPLQEVIEKERRLWLRDYPPTGTERVEGRIYLEDYYDPESIQTDQLIYLALKRLPISIFDTDTSSNYIHEQRRREYLLEAFSKLKKRMKKEQIPTIAAYDKKYSIHFNCQEWLTELSDLLSEESFAQTRKEVLNYLNN